MGNERDDYSELSADEIAAREAEDARSLDELAQKAREGDQLAELELASRIHHIPLFELITDEEEESRCV